MNINSLYKTAGEYRHYTSCRFCFSSNLIPVIDLGYVPLAGGFLKSQALAKKERFYPLEIAFCKDCYLLQSTNVIDKDTLFKDYFYHSSAIKTLTNHFISFAGEIKMEYEEKTNPFIIEIGCNDGTLLQEFMNHKINVLGVDPATNIVTLLIKRGMPIINDYFSEKISKKVRKKYGQADVICSFNALAHIENMHDILKGVKTLLKDDGSFIFETHYLGNLIDEMQYDMIYHEHQYYYSLMTLQKFFAQYDMEVYDVKPIQIHAGSMRYYVQNKNIGKNKITTNVTKLLENEILSKFNEEKTYISYAKKILDTKKDILTLLNSLKHQNKTIAGYGASGRGTIIMNFCGLDQKYLDYVIDDSPAKQGAYTPGTHLQIVNSNILDISNRPDYVVLFAWSFFEEIKQKNKKYLASGGKFILPLPQINVIKK